MTIRESHLEVVRTARYAVLGQERAPGQVWIVCHGYRQLAARFLRHFHAVDDGSRLVAAPEALSRFYLDDDDGGPHGPEARVGATWMTREDRTTEIADYVRYLDTLHAHLLGGLERQPHEVVALGFSQGAATVSRWIAQSTARVDHLVLWAGLLPADLDLAAARDRIARLRSLTLVAGVEDRYADDAALAGQAARLKAADLAFRVVRFQGGHVMDAATLERIAAEL